MVTYILLTYLWTFDSINCSSTSFLYTVPPLNEDTDQVVVRVPCAAVVAIVPSVGDVASTGMDRWGALGVEGEEEGVNATGGRRRVVFFLVR